VNYAWLLGRKGTCRVAIFSYTNSCVMSTCLDETNVSECAAQCWHLTCHASVWYQLSSRRGRRTDRAYRKWLIRRSSRFQRTSGVSLVTRTDLTLTLRCSYYCVLYDWDYLLCDLSCTCVCACVYVCRNKTHVFAIYRSLFCTILCGCEKQQQQQQRYQWQYFIDNDDIHNMLASSTLCSIYGVSYLQSVQVSGTVQNVDGSGSPSQLIFRKWCFFFRFAWFSMIVDVPIKDMDVALRRIPWTCDRRPEMYDAVEDCGRFRDGSLQSSVFVERKQLLGRLHQFCRSRLLNTDRIGEKFIFLQNPAFTSVQVESANGRSDCFSVQRVVSVCQCVLSVLRHAPLVVDRQKIYFVHFYGTHIVIGGSKLTEFGLSNGRWMSQDVKEIFVADVFLAQFFFIPLTVWFFTARQ